MNKKILGILLAAIVLLVMMTTGAMAENTHDNHCVCGATHRAIGEHTDEIKPVEWTAISSADDFTKNKASGYDYLTKNIELSKSWQFTKARDIVLCLNGHNITFNGNSGSFISSSNSNVNLTLTDCKNNAGTISGFKGSTNGGAVFVADGKTFTMHNGVISGNTAKNGAGVYVDAGGTFYMYGGKITENTASTLAGGVYVKGTFTVAGAPVVNQNANSNTAVTYPSSMYKYTKNIYSSGEPLRVGTGGLAAGAQLDVTPIFPVSPSEKPAAIATIATGCEEDYSNYFTFTSGFNYTKEYSAAKGEVQLKYIAPPPPTVTVTFDMQGHGEQIEPQTIEEGTCAIKPTVPTVAGWRFLGWEDDYGTWDFGWEIWNDMTLHAKWEQEQYSIIYDANGGQGSMTDETPVTYGQQYKLPQNIFTAPEGMYFKAWSIDGKTYQPEDEITIKGNTTITAVWTVQENSALPQTGDHSHIELWLALVSVSLAGGTMILAQRKHREN